MMLATRRTAEPPVFLLCDRKFHLESLAASGKYRQTLAPGGVLVKNAQEINAIDAPSRRERSIGEHPYWMEMNPDGVYHKVVYSYATVVVGSSLERSALTGQARC
jgi:hypothetical protein